jgi:hypothetical protein
MVAMGMFVIANLKVGDERQPVCSAFSLSLGAHVAA